MEIMSRLIEGKKISWILRSAQLTDALEISELRVAIDGETDYLDREPGEDYLSQKDFEDVIEKDLCAERSIFLVAVTEGKIIGYARCIGKKLSRFQHQAELGICILKEYCGKGIGTQLLRTILDWSESAGIDKITLTVVETNTNAIHLYKNLGFVQEGLLRKDRIHNDGEYYNTLLMARFRN